VSNDKDWLNLSTTLGGANVASIEGVPDGTLQDLFFNIGAHPDDGSTPDPRTGTISITVDKIRTMVFTVRQYANNAIEFADDASPYTLTAAADFKEVYKFTVKSKAPWRSSKATDANSIILQMITTGSAVANWSPGSEFWFRVAPKTGGPYSATFRFESITDEFDYYEFTISAQQ
jgi:hypothetical protein